MRAVVCLVPGVGRQGWRKACFVRGRLRGGGSGMGGRRGRGGGGSSRALLQAQQQADFGIDLAVEALQLLEHLLPGLTQRIQGIVRRVEFHLLLALEERLFFVEGLAFCGEEGEDLGGLGVIG